VYVTVNAALLGVWVVTGSGSFWPGWMMFAWGVGLGLNAYTVYGPHRVTEARIQRERRERRRDAGTRPRPAEM
jgi:hypothetical protein